MSEQRKRSESYPIMKAVKPLPKDPLHEQIISAKVDTSRMPDLKFDGKISPDYESYMTVYRIGRMVAENYTKIGEYVASIMGEFEMANSCRIHVLPNNVFQGNRSSGLEHWLSVLKEGDRFGAYESGEPPQAMDEGRRALLRESFYGRKPFLLDYDLGLRLVFENLDMNDRSCTVYPLQPQESDGKKGSLAVMPLYYRDSARLLGVVEFEGDLACRGSAINGIQRSLFTAHAAMMAASQISYALTHRMDPKTDLSKDIDYEKDFKQGISQLAENKIKSLWHIMMDVDNFKLFNDRHGHDVGDLVLKLVAETIKESVRSNDNAYRVGGEEFTVILPDVTEQEALAIAERIRSNIEKKKVDTSAGALGVTVSMGILRVNDALARIRMPFGVAAKMNDVMIDFVYEQVKKNTEKGLRDAKDSGKNRVCVCDPDRITPLTF
jgi:diguanylate cyclase (GGDEF)-like protein